MWNERTTQKGGLLSQKKLPLIPLTMLVTGNMMGSGIFLLPASLAEIGSIALLGWVVTSIGAIALSLLFVRLRSLSPQKTGLFAFTEAGLGRYVGSQIVYGYWVSIWIGNMAVALSAVGYLSHFYPRLQEGWNASVAAIVLIWLLTFLNLRDIRLIGRFQVVTASCLFLPVLGVTFFGWQQFEIRNLVDSFNVSGGNSHWAFSESLTLTLWSFIGLESACNLAGHAKNPERDVPYATLLGTLIAAFFYILCSTAMMGVVPSESLKASASPFSLAASYIFGVWAGNFVSVIAVIACVGSLSGWVLMHGQIAFSASKDRLLPVIFSRLNRHGSPQAGLLITAAVMSFMLLITMEPTIQKHFEFIVLIAVYLMLLAYLCAAISCHVLQCRSGNTRHAGWNLIILLSLGYCFWGLSGAGIEVLIYGSILLLLGGFMYWWIHRKKK